MEEERMAVVRGGEGGIVEISSEVSGLRIVGAVKVDQGIFSARAKRVCKWR